MDFQPIRVWKDSLHPEFMQQRGSTKWGEYVELASSWRFNRWKGLNMTESAWDYDYDHRSDPLPEIRRRKFLGRPARCFAPGVGLKYVESYLNKMSSGRSFGGRWRIQTFSIRHTQMKSRAVTLAIKNHSHFLQEKVDLQGVGSLLIVHTAIGGVCGIFFPVSSPRSTNVCLSSCGGKIRSARFLVEMGRVNDTLSNY